MSHSDTEQCCVCGEEATWFTSKIFRDPNSEEISNFIRFKYAEKIYYCDRCKKEKENG